MGDPRRRPGNLARHELIGLRARVAAASDPTQVGLEGEIVDETQGTLVLETEDGERRVAKAGRRFAVTLDGETVEVDGDAITERPAERTKKVRSW